MNANEILRRWSLGEKPTAEDCQTLLAAELEDSQRAKAFEINAEIGLKKIEVRSRLFENIYPALAPYCPGFAIDSPQTLKTLWTLWLPLALQLQTWREAQSQPLILGILGVQGTGKSTLAGILSFILAQLGYPTLNLSLDDLYKTYAERQQLQQQDPRLIWRGPPGTHDVQLGIELLDRIHRREFPLSLPRFDKSLHNGVGDRIAPETAATAEILLFEGWFVGAQPIDDKAFENPPAPIVTAGDRDFARTCNQRLAAYLPLWQRCDRLLVLYPLDYRWSLDWRKEAEQKMKASGKAGMSDAEIEQFVRYFWRSLHPELFVTPLLQKPVSVDFAIAVNRDRTTGSIYCPETRC
ncbi:glycerate kinase [Oscillatoria sp. FACHB-1406]|nr:glycerate kinase [Oscillatoria sp. FACHB-1406]MBD2578053.1 glycerate kinase [Oscillatoria sp. FACHB-1406]